MSEDLTWWDKLCLRIGLCWDAPPEPAPVATVAPVAPDAGEGVGLTVSDKIELCLGGLKQVAFFSGFDEPDVQQLTMLRSVIAEKLRAEPSLAVVVEVPAGSAMFVPSELHFVAPIEGDDVEALVGRIVAGRRGVFDADFFRIDETPAAGPVTKSFAPAGQVVPPRGLLPFTVKENKTGGGAPPPVRRR